MTTVREDISPAITRRHLLRWLATAAGTAGLAACGGGSAPGAPGDGSGDGSEPPSSAPPAGAEPSAPFTTAGAGREGATVSPAMRLAALQSVEARLTALFDPGTGRASAAQMLAHLAAEPAFRTVGFSATGDVYAIFTDGRPLIVTVDARTTSTGVSDGPAGATPGAARRAVHATSAPRASTTAVGPTTSFEAGIPSAQFRNLNTWFSEGPAWPAKAWCRESVFMSDIGTMGAFMAEFGYRQVRLGDGPMGVDGAITVEGLKQVRGDGVFFWTTHGGTLDPDGRIVQGLMTGTPAFQSTVEDTYADEFAEGTLLYYTGPLCMSPTACLNSGGGGTVYTRLAITPKFIRKYAWSFTPYSLVFVNACASATGDMKQAFLDAGASLYLGWTRPVRLWAMCGAALDFFSLMLGLNENGGANALPAEVNPRQRPCAWGDALELLRGSVQTASYMDDEDGLVELEPTANAAGPLGFLALRPSIYRTSFDERKSEWRLIGGMFGTNEGTAAIGTSMPCGDPLTCSTYGGGADRRLAAPTPVRVDDWKSENVVLTVPRTGPGSAGILQLDVDGRWSNGVQLTRVSFPMRAVRSFGGTLQVEVHVPATSFRGDFRGVRLQPVQEPTYDDSVGIESDPDAEGTWTASGRHTYAVGQETATVELSGSGTLALDDGTSGARLSGGVDPKTRDGRFFAQLQGLGVRETITYARPGYADRVETREIGFAIGSQAPGAVTPELAVPFSGAWRADTITTTFSEAAGGYGGAPSATTFACGPFSSEFPPDERVGGR